MLKSELVSALNNNEEFIKAKAAFNAFTTVERSTPDIINEFLSSGDIKSNDEVTLVQYLLYSLTIETLAYNLREKITGKEWTQIIGEIEFNLCIDSVVVGEGADPIIIVKGTAVPSSKVLYYNGREFKIHIHGWDIHNGKFKQAIADKIRLYAYPIYLQNSGHIDDLKIGEFTFKRFQEFLKTLS